MGVTTSMLFVMIDDFLVAAQSYKYRNQLRKRVWTKPEVFDPDSEKTFCSTS